MPVTKTTTTTDYTVEEFDEMVREKLFGGQGVSVYYRIEDVSDDPLDQMPPTPKVTGIQISHTSSGASGEDQPAAVLLDQGSMEQLTLKLLSAVESAIENAPKYNHRNEKQCDEARGALSRFRLYVAELLPSARRVDECVAKAEEEVQ